MSQESQNLKPHLKKPVLIVIIFIAVLFGGLLIWNLLGKFFMNHYFANFQPPPISVSVSKAEAKNWQNFLQSVGTLKAIQTVEVTPETSGMVESILFNSGEKVEKGDLLVQLGDSTEKEELKRLEAELTFSKLTANRLNALIKKNATSQAELDQAQAKLTQAQAQVEKTKIAISDKRVKAPFSGKLGIRKVNLGQYVSPGDKLVSLDSIHPLYLDFSLPEKHLKQLYLKQPILFTVSAYPKINFPGKITAIDSKSNQNTHNVLIQATVPNEDEKLYPGLFAKVKIMLPVQKQVIIVPQTAVTYSLYGDAVFVVQESKKKKGKPVLEVVQKYVTVGARFDDKVVIEKGLNPNDTVVTSGQLKLQNGSIVTINHKIKL
jgi:membrane fusion protein, multidrug efflux system